MPLSISRTGQPRRRCCLHAVLLTILSVLAFHIVTATPSRRADIGFLYETGYTYPKMERDLKRKKRSCYRLPPGVKDPCENKTCPYRSWCVPTPNGKQGRCICRNECYDVGDSDDKVNVCGTDGVDYTSMCQLRRASCKNMITINIKYRGKCDPCADYKCPFHRKCKLDNSRKPYCACNYQCQHMEYKPVCTNDGRTFDNECRMRHAACNANTHLSVLYHQSCDTAKRNNPCSSDPCTHPHHMCRVNRNLKATCLCLESCPPVFKPVCGSDLVTYDNECELKKLTCQQGKDVKINYEGPCSNINLCLKKHPECRNHEICRLSANQNPVCECPTCPQNSVAMGNRVCGSDGKTYNHACELYSKACKEKMLVTVKSDGPCDLCKNKVCKFYARCQMDHRGQADCVCPNTCVVGGMHIVCGSDGVTYENDCQMKQKSCNSRRLIEVVARGPCKTCPKGCPLGSMCLNGRCVCLKKCSSMPMEVCGTDGHFYRNECELRRIACIRKEKIEIDLQNEACRGRKNKSFPKSPSCVCNELGSISLMCNPSTRRCRCKKGVVGQRCDRCNITYWGLRTNQGCKPCACDRRGSSRNDCDQMTGQCLCKAGVLGVQCDRCPPNKQLTEHGCRDIAFVACQLKKCAHGAVCKFRDGKTRCVCDIRCEDTQGGPVCGEDRNTYRSECALKKENCKRQKTVLTKYSGRCTEDGRPREESRNDKKVHTLNLDSERKIGDFCLNHKQCDSSVPGSRCSYGQCECPANKTPSPDRMSCVESFRLLSADEKAITRDAGVNFDRESYIAYNPFSKYGRHIAVNITLAPSDSDGLIFYNGPKTASGGDYISLSLEKGYVIFRFDLGSGTLELTNLKKLSLERTHTIYIERRGRRGTLKVDAEQPVSGKSPGKLRSLNAKSPLIIGNRNSAMNIPPHIRRNLFNSFKGCLLSFILLNKRMNKEFNILKDSKPLAQAKTDGACIPSKRNPCISKPCMNGGLCGTNYQGKFTCKCPEGTFGKQCEKDMTSAAKQVRTAEFNGKTLIKIPTKTFALRKRIELEIWFLSQTMNGLLALLSDEDGEHFLSVMLMNGRVQLVCRTGNGIVMVRSSVVVNLAEWNKVVVKKGRKFVSLVVNDNRRARARIVPNFFKSLKKEDRRRIVHFNVRGQPLFLGGYPNNILSSASMGTDVWFTGAIQKVLLNRKQINLFMDPTVQRFNVTEWKGAPCGPSHSVCGRGTVCEPRLNSAHCKCVNPPCEHAMQDNPDSDIPINFDGKTLLKMKNMIKSKVKVMRRNNIRLVMKTGSKNGLVLLMSRSRYSSAKKDFLLLALRDGYPEFAVNVGRKNGLIRIRGPYPINDHKWHTVHILRSQNMATLLVDGLGKTGYLRTDKDTLNTDGNLWIGGSVQPVAGFPWEYRVGYVGCIEHLYLNEDPVTFSKHTRVKKGRLTACTIPFEF